MTRRSALLLLACLLLAPAAEAKRVFIDFGENLGSGNSWDSAQSFEADLLSNVSSEVELGFSVSIGGVSYDSIILNENGAVTFGTALSTTFTSVTSLADLGVPIIAAYYADMESSVYPSDDVFEVQPGETLYSRGQADPRPDSTGSYSASDFVPAFHVTWAGPSVAGVPVFTDLVIYSLGADGSFAIQLGHGTEADSIIPAELGGIAGYALGGQTLNLNGIRSATDDLYYEFRVGGSPPPVPEPSGILAFAAGLGLLAIAKRRLG